MSSTKALRTRTLLLDCARNIILDEGLERLSMDRVAKAAGLSKGAVMYHFETKRALQAALLQDYAAHLERGLAEHEALFEGTPAETLIPGFLEWFRSFEADNRGWAAVGIQLLSLQQSDPALLEPVRMWYARLFDRAASLPARQRPRALLVLMALEGFFFTHKFGLDLVSGPAKEAVCRLMLELACASNIKRRPDAKAQEEPLTQ